ncbi:hypothetical protein N0V94_003183 [Neodidymelliopsis sp. IMI 364377]|nr:hypothetical protein N0V94_003183 [Neodidymelliopsis sp. IMI 364377]
MHYSIILASLVALTAAAPMNMEHAKQATDTSYGTYGEYAEYSDYGAYPSGVEETAKMQGRMSPALLCIRTHILSAISHMKRDTMMKGTEQAKDGSYGSYGKYGDYSDYGTYEGGVEEAAAKMQHVST